MAAPLEKPQALNKENEQRVVQMLKDVVQGSWGELFAAKVGDLVEERMAKFRESLTPKGGTDGLPEYIQHLIAQAGKGADNGRIVMPDGRVYVPETADELIREGGLHIRKGNADPVSRIVTAIAAAKWNPRMGADGWYKDHYGEDDIHKALMATDAVAGGFLVPEAMSSSVIELLRPRSVVMQMNPVIEMMETGTMILPGFATGSSASYIGEYENITATEPTFRQVQLIAKKLAAILPISNDLIRRRGGTSNSVRDDLINAANEKMDTTFIRSDGTNGEPRGVRYQANAANLQTVNASVITENVYDDLADLMLALLNNDVRMIRPGWLMAPRTWLALMVMTDQLGNRPLAAEMSNGRLFGIPFAYTNNIPINLAVTGTNESELYLVDFADVVIGQTLNLVLDVTTDGSFYDGSALQSAFSRDLTLIRAIVEHDLVVRHDYSIAVKTDVDWVGGITT